MQLNFSDIIRSLWEDGFFKTDKSFREIKSELAKLEYNPSDSTLRSAIDRAKFLNKKGSSGNYRYIQKCNSNNINGMSTSKIGFNTSSLSEREIHPKIIEVSGKLFSDGHHSQAIFEGFKMVNLMVKQKSGLKDLDGKDLMAQAFKHTGPKLRWSKLNTISDKNEQEGYMFLFMGAMVGIRNPKAHEHIVQNDPIKTLEFLAFASLLAKKVDEAEIVSN